MSTIAFDGKSLAADRLLCAAYKTRGRKIWRLSTGALLGGAGIYEQVLAVRAWLEEGGAKPERLEEFSGILVEVNGTAYRLGEKLMRIPILERCAAVGSGAPFAITAMMGFKTTASEAVRIAARFDEGTGGGVDVLER